MRGVWLAIALIGLTAAAPERYAEGQVWEYRPRLGDEGSLLKIQSVGRYPAFAKTGPVYHVSIIGFRLGTPRVHPVLPHAPVTEAVLDASVTRLHLAAAAFPSANDGIKQWREAEGGVFTISISEIVGILDGQAKKMAAEMDVAK